MNHLTYITHLQNRYFFMRHGKSLANTQEIIVSYPEHGLTEYGLVEEGVNQATQSVKHMFDAGILDDSTRIISSDFLRTRETAEIARSILGAEEIIISAKLRERNFGDYELKSSKHYQDIWQAEDVSDPEYTSHGVESTASVCDRTTSLVVDLEANYVGATILLVSHGDTLQILMMAFEGLSPALHLNVPHMQTGEILEVKGQDL